MAKNTSKKGQGSAKAEVKPAIKEETPVKEEVVQPEIPFEGGIAPEIPKEDLKVDVVETDKDVLPLQDKVLVNDEDLPKVDAVAIDNSSIYEEDIEVLDEPVVPAKEEDREWVTDPKLLRKTEGYKDTLSGTLYKGIRK